MRRVLHLWQSHYPWEVRVGKINRSLLARGSAVQVLARNSGSQPTEELLDSVQIRRVGGFHRAVSLPIPGNPFWASEISGSIREFKPDLILVRDIPLALSASRLGRKAGIPVILDMAEHYPEAMRSWKKYSENPVLRKLVHDWKIPDRLEARVVSQVDGILVVCDEQKQRLIEEYRISGEKICVVLNTPELVTKGPGTPFEARQVSKNGRTCFGYHGILCEDRELEVVLRGFDLCAKTDPGIELLMAGGGESEIGLRALADSLSSKDRIRFTGRYKPEDLPGLYQEADFGIVSLRVNRFTQHTVANKFFDYAALGKPFIFTDVTPLVTVMKKMNWGSPESAAEAFRNIQTLNYPELAARGRAAIDREFNWEIDSRRMLDFMATFSTKSLPG